ncbi:MAG: hypothetical protein ACC645_13455 [Pirellulales bacterium]
MIDRASSRSLSVLPRGSRRRSGAVLVAALVCLLIVTAMIGTMLERAVSARRQLRVERDRRQAELLLQAGVDRAALRLVRQTDYQGETWMTPEEVMAGRGQVTIEALRASDTTSWRVHVIAEYPFGSERSIRRSRTFVLPSPLSAIQE